jgi:hypothetical protein
MTTGIVGGSTVIVAELVELHKPIVLVMLIVYIPATDQVTCIWSSLDISVNGTAGTILKVYAANGSIIWSP